MLLDKVLNEINLIFRQFDFMKCLKTSVVFWMEIRLLKAQRRIRFFKDRLPMP